MKENGAVAVTNYYKPYRNLQILKKVEGDMGDQNRSFAFSVMKNGEPMTSGTYGNTVVSKGSFQLKSGQSMTISKLKETDQLTVTEADGNKEGYRTSYTVNDGKNRISGISWTEENGISEGTTKLTFYNCKVMAVPTGITENGMPFLLMLLAGFGMAAVQFAGKRRKRS